MKMKYDTRLACGLFTLVLTAAGLFGCSSTTPAKTMAERTTLKQQQFQEHPDFWRNRLEPESEMEQIGPIPIGDRRVTLKVRHLIDRRKTQTGWTMLPDIKYTQYQTIHARNGGFYELVDSDTGQVILPLDYWEIVPVPGVGVYVHTQEERLVSINARFNKTTPPAWRKLDLATGQMPITDVLLALTYLKPSVNYRYSYTPNPLKYASVLGRADPASTPERPLTQFEVYPVYKAGTPPVTQPLVDGRVLGKTVQSQFTGAGMFSILASVDEQNRTWTLLLDEQLRYLMETDQPVRTFHAQSMTKLLPSGARAVVSFLAMTAPGTNLSDDLWVILDENGQFGAPSDVIGYRPFNKDWQQDDGSQAAVKPFKGIVERWLVRKRTDATTPFTDHPGGGRVFNARWTMVRGDFSPLPVEPRIWDLQLVRVPWIDRHQDNTSSFTNTYTDGRQYERVFMACVQWEGWSIVDPFGKVKDDRSFATVFAKIASPSEVVPQLTAMHQREVAFRAKLQKVRDAYIAQKAKEALEKRIDWINRNWSRCLDSGNYKWCMSVADERGANSWYDIAKAMKNPTTEFIKQVMSRTPAEYLQKELNTMLANAKKRDAQAFEEYLAREKEQKRLRWLAAHPPDPASFSSYRTSSGGSSSRGNNGPGGAFLAGWQVSDAHKRAYLKTQQNVNKGWGNPYGF